MRTIIILIVVILAMTSCSSSSEYTQNKRRARVYQMEWSSANYKWIPMSVVQFKFVDTLAKPGDIVELVGTRYLIDSIGGTYGH